MPSTALSNSGPRPIATPPVDRPRPPPPAVEAEEAQWLFTEDEVNHSPSVMDGMSVEEERALRRKGINFILQVGMMLKLPQTTMSTAAVFFNRYLMRNSLKAKPGYKPLHHYQIAATTLFLATKVEETCRKLKELVVSCVRVALKDPNKLVDEQTKDFWKWRDTILYSEDVVLESLCFDLAVEPPYKPMFKLMHYLGLHHNKEVRNATWAFLSDADMTQLCLLFSSRTIAAAGILAGAKIAGVQIPTFDPEEGKPWWEVQHVKLADIRRAIDMMAEIYAGSPGKDGEPNMYEGLRRSPDTFDCSFDTPGSGRHGESQGPQQSQETQSQPPANEKESASQGDVAMGNANANGADTTAPSASAPAAPAAQEESGSGSEEGELSG